jgi:hypothetical protein
MFFLIICLSTLITDYDNLSFEASQNQRLKPAFKTSGCLAPRAELLHLHLASVAAPAVWMSSASARWLSEVHPWFCDLMIYQVLCDDQITINVIR